MLHSLAAEVKGGKGFTLEQMVVVRLLNARMICLYAVCWWQFYFFNPFVSTYAYVTYQDIKQGSLRDQTVIVVKAPTDTKLEVPDPEEVCIQAFGRTFSLTCRPICDSSFQ